MKYLSLFPCKTKPAEPFSGNMRISDLICWLSAKITDMAYQNIKLSREVSQLKEVENDLNRYKSEMELFVQERTAELIKANKLLQRKALVRDVTQEQIARKSLLLDAINHVLHLAISDRDEQALALAFLTAARQLTSSPLGFVLEHITHHGQDSWQVMAISANVDEPAPAVQAFPAAFHMNAAMQDVWRRLVESGDALIRNSGLAVVPDMLFTPSPAISCLLALPLKLDGKLSGLILLANTRHGYTPADQKDSESLAEVFCQALLRKRFEQEKNTSEKRLKMALDSANEGLWDYWPQKSKIYFSSQWFTILGYLPEEFTSSLENWISLTHMEDLALFQDTFEKVISGEEDDFYMEIRMMAKTGQWRWMRASGRTGERDAQGVVLRILGTMSDISKQKEVETALKKANDELQRLATLDSLTQIANRRRFDDQLNLEWRRALRENKFLAVIMCDIDYFKKYNDTYGHVKGDEALHAVAQSIAASLKRPMDLVTRYGGEEFAILLPDTDIHGAVQVAGEIKRSIDRLGIEHSASPVHKAITLSFGAAAVAPDGTIEPKEMIETADRALYQAKSRGRNCIVRLSLLPNSEGNAICCDSAGRSGVSKMNLASVH